MVRSLFPPATYQEIPAYQTLKLVKADCFSLQQLTDAYNQTRVDYIVPMPMNVERLSDYIKLYDIDLSASWVAMRGERIFGLGMLGLRDKRAWITRVGVLPHGRRQGTGRAITNRLIQTAAKRGADTIWLEVIKGNEPARLLFLTSGFLQTRELVVARRPPEHIAPVKRDGERTGNSGKIRELSKSEAFRILDNRKLRSNWLNETESFRNMADVSFSLITLDNDARGLIVYRKKELRLDHVFVETIHGEPAYVTSSALNILHQRHETRDAIMENLSISDSTWEGFTNAGYFEVFRRIEMAKKGLHLLIS